MKIFSIFIMFIVAFVVGSATSTQSRINSSLGIAVGTVRATFISCLIGFVLVTILLLVNSNNYPLKDILNVDKKLFLGGFLGPIIIIGYNYLIPKYGSTFSLSLVLVFQLATVVLIDHYGFLGPKIPLNFPKVIGVTLVLTGAYLTRS
jgi:bacterial/archaeal transporter family-2 protein